MDALNTKIKNILTEKTLKVRPENIKDGVTMFGIEGTLKEGVDTSDANAVANDIVTGKTAYVNGSKLTGTYTGIVPSGTKQITENGTVDVTNYASANVNVSATTNKSIAVTPINSPGTSPYILGYITEVDTTNWDITNITSLFTLFNNCKYLSNINLAGFNVSNNISSTESMFTGCSRLTSVDLKPFNMANITSMENMFSNCTNLVSVDFSNCNLSKVNSTKFLFRFDSNLTNVNFTNVTLPKVTVLQNTFTGCTSLSNDSLNQILALLATATIYTGTKTLKYIGLSSTQATTCTTLSNWSTAQTAGWTTGY